jgi:DNA polymerase III delta subunit
MEEIIKEMRSKLIKLRSEAEAKITWYEEHRLMLQSAALEYKVDAYNEALGILRDAEISARRQKERHYAYESNLTDVEINWL